MSGLQVNGVGGAPAQVEIGSGGGIDQVSHAGRDGGYLARPWAPRSATVDGRTAGWLQRHRHDDAGEVEVGFVWEDDPAVRLTVRHASEPLWSERWVLEVAESPDPDAAPVSVDAFVLDLSPASDVVGWGVAAGAEARFALLPGEGRGPVLGATLQSGSVSRFGPGTVRIGPVRLRPGGRYVVSWLLAWHESAQAFKRGLSTVLPEAMALRVGEVWDLPYDPDAAVLAPDSVSVSVGERGTEIVGEIPGDHAIEIRSAKGTVVADVSWVPELSEVAGFRAAELLERGVPLVDSADALLVQYSIGSEAVHDDDATTAIDRYTGEHDPDDVFSQIVLAREALRDADAGLLRVAALGLTTLPAGTAGYGLAAAQTAIAQVVAGGLPTATIPVPPETADLSALVRAGQALEQALLDPALRAERVPRLTVVGAHLGAGLAGSRLLPAADDEVAYLVAVLGLVPDELGQACLAAWGCSVPVLAERTRTGLLGDPHLSPAALAWLTLADS